MLSHHPHVRILIFTIHDSSVFAERALRMGVSGYITKSSDPDVLLEAVAQVAAGETLSGTGYRERAGTAPDQQE